MNTQLIYGTKGTFSGFADQSEWMQNSLTPFITSKTYTKQDVFDMANNCRDNYNPVFANETKYLPSNQESIGGDAGAVVVTPIQLQESKQIESQTQTQTNDNTTKDFLKSKQFKEGLIVGGVLFVLYKIFA
jgi:hypothetical protein